MVGPKANNPPAFALHRLRSLSVSFDLKRMMIAVNLDDELA
jgi:hypothetical protein